MMLLGIERLAPDAETEVIVLISKPPAGVADASWTRAEPPETRHRQLSGDDSAAARRRRDACGDARGCCATAVAVATGDASPTSPPPMTLIPPSSRPASVARSACDPGLYSGGTLAYGAACF